MAEDNNGMIEPHPDKVYEEDGSPPTTWRGSPNYKRFRDRGINLIVIHQTASSTAESALSWFEDPGSQVSAHYVIDKDGTIWQCVRLMDIAWHCKGFNQQSVGIECVAKDGEHLAEAQSASLVSILKFLLKRFNLDKSRVTGHRFLTQSTNCPGALFGPRTEQALRDWLDRNVP